MYLANIEVNYIVQNNMHQDFSGLVDKYKEYWDNEYPRLGETRGFYDFMNQSSNGHAERVEEDNSKFEMKGTILGEIEECLERERRIESWIPKTTVRDAEFVQTNPESVVFFDDIEDCVIRIGNLHETLLSFFRVRH